MWSIQSSTARLSRTSDCLRHVTVYLLAVWGLVTLSISVASGTTPWRTSDSQILPARHSPTHQPDPYRPTTLPQGLNQCDCGRNTAEAAQRSCIYDEMAAAWLPPACRDPELTLDFQKAGPNDDGSWSYFADAEGRHQISNDGGVIGALADTGSAFWVSREWHLAHCTFYWRKYARMKDTGAIMEERFDGEGHVKHCARLLLKEPPQGFFLLEVQVRLNGSADIDDVHTGHM